MLLIRKDSIKNKYQNGSLSSSDTEKKLTQNSRILTLYRVSYSGDLGIPDLWSISIGFHTVKICDFWANFFWAVRGSKRAF